MAKLTLALSVPLLVVLVPVILTMFLIGLVVEVTCVLKKLVNPKKSL
jgi:hypothetical protein